MNKRKTEAAKALINKMEADSLALGCILDSMAGTVPEKFEAATRKVWTDTDSSIAHLHNTMLAAAKASSDAAVRGGGDGKG